MPIALTRAVSPSLAACELTHLRRAPIDVARATAQHAAYERCLAGLGCEVIRVGGEPDADLPDSVFIEDTALVLDEVAIALRPGAAPRRGEVAAVADALAAFREVIHLDAPATMDGGDVLRLGRRLYVGLSTRTNAYGIDRLRTLVAGFGYEVLAVPVAGCLHLKSAVTEIGDCLVLLDPRAVDGEAFEGVERVEIDASEPAAANALRVGETVVMPSAHVRTAERVARRGVEVRTVDVTELARAEGGVTCCSLMVARTQ
jgi:dimethylargininase